MARQIARPVPDVADAPSGLRRLTTTSHHVGWQAWRVTPSANPPVLPSVQRQSVPEHPSRDARVPLVAAILGKRLLVPELVRRRPVGQLEQQRGADVVSAIGRADRSAEDEAVAIRGEVRLVRVEVRAEELRRAGLGSRAQELLQALAAIVGLALLEAVRPAVNFDALVDAGLVHGLARDECVRRRAVVELHEERRAERVAAVVGDEMAVADDALAEIFDVALLVRQQGAPRGVHPRLVPAIDRPLRRLRAVVVAQRLAAQSISRIARQISGHVRHFICEIAQDVSYHAGPISAPAFRHSASQMRVNALMAHAGYASLRPLLCSRPRTVAVSCSPSTPIPNCSPSPTTTAMA